MLFSLRNIFALCLGLILAGAIVQSDPVHADKSGESRKPGDLAFWEELAFWEAIKDSKDPAELKAYLSAYPNGRFARLAELRLKALTKVKGLDSAPNSAETASDDGKASGETKAGDATGAAAGGSAKTAAATTAPAAGNRFQDCTDCPLMVVVPAGSYLMGSDRFRREEKPRHKVTFGRPFAIGVYEITVREWDACLREGGCSFAPAETGDDRLPVSNVSWDDAQEYTAWLSKTTGKQYRLPTEAEWEYAASGGTKSPFWWGSKPGRAQANCSDCGSDWDGKGPAPVGSFEPNPFGLHDVHGNLWEWTLDCVNGSYQGAPTDGSAWLRGDCIARVLRGGSWRLGSDYMRTTRRNHYDRDVRYYLHGFRVVRPLP